MNIQSILAAAGTAAILTPALAQDFDACAVFTQDDAQKALGQPAAAEPVNPKVKRPKVVPACSYSAVKDGKPIVATVSFKFGKTDAETQKAFEEARMQFQTKPMLISGAEAFWSGKTGEMMLRKGRTWMTVAVGPPQPNLREVNDAKKLAEILAKRM